METKPIAETIAHAHSAGVEFLITDAKAAQTFLDLAETTSIPESRSRRIEEAHTAYRTILRLLPGLILTEKQRLDLDKEMEVLKARLRRVGVSVD